MSEHGGQTPEGIQQEGSHPQAKERGLRRNQICQNQKVGLPASRSVRKFITVVFALESVTFCFGSLSKHTQTSMESYSSVQTIPTHYAHFLTALSIPYKPGEVQVTHW